MRIIIVIVIVLVLYIYFREDFPAVPTPSSVSTRESEQTKTVPKVATKTVNQPSKKRSAAAFDNPIKANDSNFEQIRNLFDAKSGNTKWHLEKNGGFGFTLSEGLIPVSNEAEVLNLAKTAGEFLGIAPGQIQTSSKTLPETNISSVRIFSQQINNLEIRGTEIRFFVSKKNNSIFYVTSNLYPIDEYNLNQNWSYSKLKAELSTTFSPPNWEVLESKQEAFLWPTTNHKAEIAFQFVIRKTNPFEEREVIMSAVTGEIIWNRNTTIKN
jgi:hypothetical protein